MIKLKPDSGIKSIKEIHEALKKEFAVSDEIIIDFANVERIDLSLAQLIIAASREAKKTEKAIELKSVPRMVKYQMQMCGMKI